jgi:hypothetical protein
MMSATARFHQCDAVRPNAVTGPLGWPYALYVP